MKRIHLGVVVFLITGRADSPEDFPMEIRCAEQAYDSAIGMNSGFGKSLFIAQTIVWLRKSAGLPLNAVRIPKAAKDEMFRLNAITRPPEMPLPCTLYRTFEKVVTRVNRVRSVLSVSAT